MLRFLGKKSLAVAIPLLATLAAEGPRKMLDVCPEHITDGFVFAFKAMGSVLPIAGFFFVGAGETAPATGVAQTLATAQSTEHAYRIVFTNTKQGTEAYNLYSLGVGAGW